MGRYIIKGMWQGLNQAGIIKYYTTKIANLPINNTSKLKMAFVTQENVTY